MQPTIPEGSAIITPLQMYQEQQETTRVLRELAAVVNPAIVDMRAEIATIKTDGVSCAANVTALATRVTVLETRHKVLAWVLSTFIAICAVLATVIALFVHS